MEKEKVEGIVREMRQRLDDLQSANAMEVYFPWDDVLASMKSQPDRVCISDIQCPDCGEKYVALYFSSPAWTWRNLCGRAGTMKICTKCLKQENFMLEIMN